MGEYITVKDLIAALQEMPQDAIVICSSDSEGNGHSPLAGIDPNCIYLHQGAYGGEIAGIAELTDEDRQMGLTDEDVYTGADGLRAIILVPTR